MFFRKKTSNEPKLLDVVTKKMDTGFDFWNINDDLGHSSVEIFKSTPLVIMSYAYARRGAAAALFIQGLLTKDGFNHVESMFKALQQQTGHTVEFQERAAADSLEFMQSYHYLISGLFIKKTIQIAREYDVPASRLSDADLFKNVLETLQAEETQVSTDYANQAVINNIQEIFGNMTEKGNARTNTVSTDIERTNRNRINSIIAELQILSNQVSKKSVTMWIQPKEESWSCEFHFSDEEGRAADDLCGELRSLMNFMVTMPRFPYKEK